MMLILGLIQTSHDVAFDNSLSDDYVNMDFLAAFVSETCCLSSELGPKSIYLLEFVRLAQYILKIGTLGLVQLSFPSV